MDKRTAAAKLIQMVNGYQVSQAICVAAALGIADHIRDGKLTSGELAVLTSTHPRALYRLLRALAAVGVFEEAADRTFSLTELGAALRTDRQPSAAPWAVFVGRPYYREAWSHLLHSVKTGENAFRHVHGKSVWDYRAEHPMESAIFDRAMTAVSQDVATAVVSAYDFSAFEVVMDVGGGQGVLLAEILSRNSGLHGILFDQPWVVTGAPPFLEGAAVADRCEIVGGDFFVGVPEGADAIVMKWIVHDWDDANNTAILKSCRRAIRSGGKLLVLESVLAPPNEGPRAKFADLNMLVSPGGEERTAEEFASLLAKADFRVTGIVAAGPRISIIEATPA